MHYGGIRSQGLPKKNPRAYNAECSTNGYRHNGIIIEPASCEKNGRGEGNSQPSALKSRSRSTSPPSNDEKNPRIHAATSTPPSSAPPGGPQNYYRQHTLPGGV